VLLKCSIVDQNIKFSECLDGLIDRSLAELKIDDVSGHCYAAAPFGFDRPLGFLGVFVLVEIGDRNVCPFPDVENRDGASDA